MKIAENMLELIGSTPIVKINKLNNTDAFISCYDRAGRA